MAVETVEVQAASGFDSSGDPIAPDEPVTLVPLEIEPGNTQFFIGDTGALDTAEFTVWFGLKVKVNGSWQKTDTVVRDDYSIVVRDRLCQARVRKWQSGGQGGVGVLCKSATGKA